MQLNELKRVTPNKKEKRVGRGGGRGKTSGRGTKGQKARAGHRMMPAIREILKKLPKRRGYRFKSIQHKPAVVNVGVLEVLFASGDSVTPHTLRERGVMGDGQMIKVLGDGDLTKKLVVSGCAVSAGARVKIEKAGGSVLLDSTESRRVAA